MSDRSHPIDGRVVLLAGAKASVTLSRLSTLLEHVQQHLVGDREEYDRRFECIAIDPADGNVAEQGDGVEVGDDGRVYFLADGGHWTDVGDDLDLTEREADAVRRAHEAQFRRDGRRTGRGAEFETAIELREPVALIP